VQAKSLTEPPFNPVSDHSSANRARDGESQAGACPWLRPFLRTRVRQAERSEQGAGKADTVVIGSSEFDSAQNPRRGRERERAAAGRFSWKPWQSEQLSRR
jgi:hypothetical protein